MYILGRRIFYEKEEEETGKENKMSYIGEKVGNGRARKGERERERGNTRSTKEKKVARNQREATEYLHDT